MILGQSQPRISRHLKLLNEAGLIDRFREGSWVYFYVADGTRGGELVRRILEAADSADTVLVRDLERAQVVKREREAAAQAFFEAHAADWDQIRAVYVAEADVEAAILDMLGVGHWDRPYPGTSRRPLHAWFGHRSQPGDACIRPRQVIAWRSG